MSKRKPKKHRQLQGDAPSRNSDASPSVTPAPQQITLSALRTQMTGFYHEKAWDKIVELSKIPLQDVAVEDQAEADTWLLQMRAWGLSNLQSQGVGYQGLKFRPELKAVLAALAAKVSAFHRMEYYFELYIRNLDVADWAEAVPRLFAACRDTADLRWICALREGTRYLIKRQPTDKAPPDPATSKLALAVEEIYASAMESDALSDEGRRAVQALHVELEIKLKGAGALRQAVQALHAIPSPSAAEAVSFNATYDSNRRTHVLPLEWAFLLELGFLTYERSATFSDFLATLARYPDQFQNELCETLRQMLLLLGDMSEDNSDALARVTQSLFNENRNHECMWLGDSLLVLGKTGPCVVDFGMMELLQPIDVKNLISHIADAAHDHPRYAEVNALARVFSALEFDSPIEDEEQAGLDMPGLDWLCNQSLPFQLAASVVIQGELGRACLLMDGLRRYTEASADELCGIQLPSGYHFEGYSYEGLALPEAQLILLHMERIAPLRIRMSEEAAGLWQTMVGGIFRAVSSFDGATRLQVLRLARTFEADLLAQGEAFRLGYLEHVAGDPVQALHYYLIEIDEGAEPSDAVLQNAKILFSSATDPTVVQKFVDLLKAASSTPSSADEVRKLLKAAQARHAVLDKQSQYEQTAKQRWPSLTMPAKKLLGVLTVIKSFTGYTELGEYAGMSAEWAERHFRKLEDTGMIFKTGTGYRINPHIKELAERENLHTVIGRIVRSEGTSAMKQVFNSQREYTIYQCMVQLCPNHLVFPNSSLQSIISYEKLKPLMPDDEFGYYLRASVDLVVVNSTTYLPMLAFEIDSPWHDTDKQQERDEKKDRIFAAAGIPFMRLRPVGSPSEATIRAQVAEHLDELVRTLRTDLPGYDQTRSFLEGLSAGTPEQAPV